MARNNTPVDKNSREYLLRQVANGRYSLLLIVILTVVNLIMTILDTNTYFLFSASVPYYLVFVGMGIENGFVDGAWNVKGTLTYTGLVIALVIVAVYLLCWLLSKKRAGWLTAALVLFIVDTVALVVITFALYDSPMGKLVDFLLHRPVEVSAIVAEPLRRGLAAGASLPLMAELLAGIRRVLERAGAEEGPGV